MTYKQLDTIADAYVPLLAILALISIAYKITTKNGRFSRLGKDLMHLFVPVFAVYALMFIDKALGIWSSVGLDYSTHTALSLVLIIFLCRHQPKFLLFYASSLLAYILLMLYQNYHSVADIISTACVIFLIHFLLLKLIQK